MASIVYLDIDQGSDFEAEFTLEDEFDEIIDLNEAKVYSQFRKSYGSSVAYDFDAFVSSASSGNIKIVLPGNVSSNIKPGRYLYDIELVVGNKKTRVIEGIVTLHPEITRTPT